MRRVLLLVLLVVAASANARDYDRAQLEGLLAPIAHYPDSLVGYILAAASHPAQVTDAARGVPAQPHWHPAVNALVPYRDVLQWMAGSPHWLHDLAEAYVHQYPEVLDALLALRSRSQAWAQPPAVVHHYVPVPVWIHPHRHHRAHAPRVVPYRRVPEAERRPIIHSTPQLFNKPEHRSSIHHKPRTFGHR